MRSSISWPSEETPVSRSLLMSVGTGMPSGGVRTYLWSGVSAAEASATGNRRSTKNLSMAFESRDGEGKQGIFGPAKAVAGEDDAATGLRHGRGPRWSKIARKFPVSLPDFTLGIRKKV